MNTNILGDFQICISVPLRQKDTITFHFIFHVENDRILFKKWYKKKKKNENDEFPSWLMKIYLNYETLLFKTVTFTEDGTF